MIDEEKLENYVDTFYETRDGDYRVRCDSGQNFFQVAVQHLEEDPEIERLVDEIFETLALRKGEWEKEIEERGGHSFLYVNRASGEYRI